MLGHKPKKMQVQELIELEDVEAKEFDEAIEIAFRYGDFEDIYRLTFENYLPIDYQVIV